MSRTLTPESWLLLVAFSSRPLDVVLWVAYVVGWFQWNVHKRKSGHEQKKTPSKSHSRSSSWKVFFPFIPRCVKCCTWNSGGCHSVSSSVFRSNRT